MFGKILVPIDDSKEAFAAIRYARIVAEKFNSTVTLLHVVNHGAYFDLDCSAIAVTELDSFVEKEKDLLKEGLEIFCDFNQQVTATIKFGDPAVIITEISESGNHSLIIMGRRGMSNVAKVVLGSVSNYVLQHAICPILIVHDNH